MMAMVSGWDGKKLRVQLKLKRRVQVSNQLIMMYEVM